MDCRGVYRVVQARVSKVCYEAFSLSDWWTLASHDLKQERALKAHATPIAGTLGLAAAVARPLGDLTVVGLGGGELPVSFFSVPHEVSIQTTYWGSRPELVELLDLAARGLVESRITKFPLAQGVEAYRALNAGEIDGRAVVVPFE